MLLSMRTHGDKTGYKTYRFACFDSHPDFAGMDFTEKFNKAFEWLRREMHEDRTTDPTLVMVDVWLC